MSRFSEETRSGSDETDRLAVLVNGIRNNDGDCGNELAQTLGRGLRLMLYRQLRNEADVEDAVQYCLMTIISAIQNGKLEHPPAVAGYARTIAQRYVAHTISERRRVRERYVLAETVELATNPNQETERAQREQTAIVHAALANLCELDREILRRFYLLEHPEERIREELGLTETQFRLRKSRAKKRIVTEADKLMRPTAADRMKQGIHRLSRVLINSTA